MLFTDRLLPIRHATEVLRRVAHTARRQRSLERAARTMPKPVPWDWAAPRLMPLLARPCFDEPGLPVVRRASDLGPAVEFGIDLGGVFLIVDEPVADRWECSADQLMARAMTNLRRRAARIEPGQVGTGAMSGWPIRLLQDRPRWASSLLLDLDSVTRLFGPGDQLLAAPTTTCLVSLPIDMPERIAATIVVDLEGTSHESLFLDPFVLEDGVLTWGGNVQDGADD